MIPPENADDAAAFDSSFASLSAGFLVGGGRFTLLRMLGRGGMGVVWLARDETLHEDVALKFLPPEIRHDAMALDDLRRETARSRRLTHANIIRIHDFYKAEHEAFISMEFIDGPNLADLHVAQTDRVFTWDYLVPIVQQLCEALDYAHGERIVHRDLKPANMMLDARGRLKLADFGIAAVVVDSASRVSMRHAQSGTSTYMSPQQMDGRLPQVTDDIYALGATLYELLTSRPPFFTGDIPHQVRNLPPQPIDQRLAELEITNPVPPDVAALIMACLAKDPALRPQSARAVADWIGLERAPTRAAEVSTTTSPKRATRPPTVRVEPVREIAPAVAVEAATTDAETAYEEPAAEITDARRRSFVPWIVAAVAVLIVFGSGGAWWWQRHNAKETDAEVETAAEESVSTGSVGEQWILRGHSERVNAVAISADGKTVASASADNTAIIWDARAAKIRVMLRAHAGDVNAVALSRDAAIAATASDDHDVRLWDVTTGVSTQTFKGHATNVLAVAISPSGRLIASSDAAGVINVWDITTGQRVQTFDSQAGPTPSLAFRDDKVLASAGAESAVRIWSVDKGKLWKKLNAYKAPVTALTFSSDGKVLATSTADKSRVHWNAENFRSRWTFRGAKETARTLSYSPDGTQLAIASDSGTLFLWDTKSGNHGSKRVATDRPVTAVALGDFEFAAASGDTVIVAPYRFRNQAGAANGGDSFVSLFNGTDLTGWEGDPGVWSVVDHNLRGTLRSSTDANHPSGLIWSGGVVEDFELRFKFRLLKAGNSGVYYRGSKLPNYEVGGYQFEIMRGNIGNLIETGSDRPRRDVQRQWFGYNGGEDWREGKITAIGSHIIHECDGRVLIDANDGFPERPRQGVLALEAAGGPTTVEFRDIRLRRIQARR